MDRFCPKTITSFIVEPQALSGWVRRSGERQVLMDLEAWCKSFHNPLEPICLWFKLPHESFADLEQFPSQLCLDVFSQWELGTGAFPRLFPRGGYGQMVVASRWSFGVATWVSPFCFELLGRSSRAPSHNTSGLCIMPRRRDSWARATLSKWQNGNPFLREKKCAFFN